MITFKSIGVRLLAVALAFAAVPAAVPEGTPLVGVSKAEAQYRHYGGGGFYGGGPRFYRPRGFYGGRGFYGNRGFYGGRGYYGRSSYYGRPGYYGGRGYYGRRYYGGRYYRHNNDGAAIAAGIIGLGVGAAIANSARPRYYDYGPSYGSSHARYCAARYRSYDPYSNTYQPYYGPRRICR